MNEQVIALIKSLINIETVETSLVEFLLATETQHIMNFCNITELPEGLKEGLIETVAGRYLQIKKGELLGDDSDIVTSIKEGDVTVQFSGESPAKRLDAVIAHLMRERDLLRYRKLVW